MWLNNLMPEDDDNDLFRRSINVDKKIKFDGIKPARQNPNKSLKATIKNQLDEEDDEIDQMFSEDYEPANLETGDELLFTLT